MAVSTKVAFGRCFVTGCAGFLGSHLAERLLSESENTVTGYDNLSQGRLEWIESLSAHLRFSFIKADLRDRETLKEAMRGHDVVFHLGANTDILEGNAHPGLDLENDIIATFNLLEAMRVNGVSQLLFTSSSTVFGEVSTYPTPEDIGPLLPISHYGAGKLACEGLISAYTHLYNIRAWIFRLGNMVGARMGHGVISDFIAKLRQNPRELEILGNGNQEKNYLLVEDCLNGMFHAYFNGNERSCDIFNLGCESTITVREIAHIVIEEMGLQGTRLRYTGGSRGWPGDVPKVVLDLSKMKKLGWQARRSSAEAVRIATRRLLGKE